MMEQFLSLLVLPIGLGLLGFVEPCSVGSALVFIKHLEGTNARGSVALGLLLGLNIPACAAPLLFALLGAVAAGGASGAPFISGFVSLSLFGLALSLPLIAAVLFAPARRGLDWLAGLSRRLPFWTGLLLIGLGAWSI
jgi:cytochrome c-type biogenesis protein